MNCAECERLWGLYEAAVFEHVRIANKLKTAEASGDSEAIHRLKLETDQAAARREMSREALHDHERAAAHGVPAPRAS